MDILVKDLSTYKSYINSFPKRLNYSNKGTYKKVNLVGGSKNYLGAPLLSLNAYTTLCLGAGYACLSIPESLLQTYALHYPELIYNLIDDKGTGKIKFNEESLNEIMKYDVIAFGMGLGVSKQVYNSLKYIIENYEGKLLIDADGLNSLAKYGVEILKDHKCEIIITPHVKEFSRLLNKDEKEWMTEVKDEVLNFANEYNVTVVLKNNSTFVTDGKEIYLDYSAKPNLAKGGTGDVLSGLIAGFLTKDESTLAAGVHGVQFLSALSNYFYDINVDENTVTASLLISKINEVLKK